MGLLFDLLPFLEGWKYDVLEVENKEVSAGGTEHIYFMEKELGWVLSAQVYVYGENGEKTELTIRTDDCMVNTQFMGMHMTGLVQRGIFMPYLNRYDTTVNIYSAGFDFPFPIPYKKFVRLSIRGPSENPVQLSGAIIIIKIRPEPGMREKFLASLRKALGTEKIAGG